MSELLVRSNLSEVVTEGRTLAGVAYKFDHPSWVSDGGPKYQESMSRSTADGLNVAGLHFFHPFTAMNGIAPRDTEPFGAVRFSPSDSEGALVFEAVVSQTRKGDDYLNLINDGALSRNVSVGFKPIQTSVRAGVTVRESISIEELSLLPHGVPGAHEGASITAVRAEILTPNRDRLKRKLFLL